MSTPVLEKATLVDLEKAQCIALTTFRKTGQAVTTPVMFAVGHGTIYVGTRADAGKLKRLRHTTRITLAPCSYSGKVTGMVREGNARILTAPEESATASAALAKKYGFMLPLTRYVWRLFHRQADAEEIYIAIEPIAG
ncbi:MAG TPA: PPOX class F420-dependent oxidoreductase [Ktedonobacterales bacterium]|nr:PPOX class F420-dependent oxidoreductase [Ktedonobacterales bacterium]